MKYWIIMLILAVSTTANAARSCSTDASGVRTCVDAPDDNSDRSSIVERPGNNNPTPNTGIVKDTLKTGISTSSQSVSSAESAASSAQHNANARANSDRWEALVCSMRPVKGKTIEGIFFRNEIPYWFNCND